MQRQRKQLSSPKTTHVWCLEQSMNIMTAAHKKARNYVWAWVLQMQSYLANFSSLLFFLCGKANGLELNGF
jgi:hypothetical protein